MVQTCCSKFCPLWQGFFYFKQDAFVFTVSGAFRKNLLTSVGGVAWVLEFVGCVGGVAP